MYLEISPRGSGKTWRLVNHADKLLNDTVCGHICVFGPNEKGSEIIKRRLLDRGHREDRILTTWSDNSIQNYFDEFDRSESKFLDKSGYYVTTASKMRKIGVEDSGDFLLQLLGLNHFCYSSYCYPSMLLDNHLLEESKKSMPKEQFDREFLNIFWE